MILGKSKVRWSRPRVDWYRVGLETNYYGLHFHAAGYFVGLGSVKDDQAAELVHPTDVDRQMTVPVYKPPIDKNGSWLVRIDTPAGSLRTQAGQALALQARLQGHDDVIDWYGPSL